MARTANVFARVEPGVKEQPSTKDEAASLYVLDVRYGGKNDTHQCESSMQGLRITAWSDQPE